MSARSEVPANGLLSGMVLTWGTAAAAVLAGVAWPGAAEVFDRPLSDGTLDALLASWGLMVAHKVESYLTGEFDQCPVYLTTGRAAWAQEPRRAVFGAFVGTFLALMLAVCLVLRGGHWPLLLLSIWVAQGLHELHHSAKSAARRGYYPGTATGLAFVASVGLWFAPSWLADLGRGGDVALWWAAAPVIWLLFFLEDRRWLRGAAAAGWRPGRAAPGADLASAG